MIDFNPPHEVRDYDKLDSMTDVIESGGRLPPIVVYENQAYTGSHRIAAWRYCNVEPNYITLTKWEFVNTLAVMDGIDELLDVNNDDDMEFFEKYIDQEIYDFSEFCSALLKVTKNNAIKEVIKDQIW